MQDIPASANPQGPPGPPPEFETLKSISEPFMRRMYLVAVLTRYLSAQGRPIVVGGHAVEYYTLGQYPTGDVDIVCARRRELDALLTAWGFTREGRHWRNDSLQLYIEAPAESLEGADPARVVEVEVEGLRLSVVGPEDLIADRLNGYVHWQYSEDGFWAEQIIRGHGEALDWEYLGCRCAQDETVQALQQMKNRWEAERGQGS
jgi:hypothetical protein